MLIEQVVLYKIKLKLKQPFAASFGSFQERESIIVELKSEGLSGWGESATLPFPFYNHEDATSVLHVMQNYLCPLMMEQQPQCIETVTQLLSQIAGNNIAKAGIESAFWDLISKRKDLPLYKFLGGIRNKIESGVVVSQFKDIKETLDQISQYLELGYKRIKLKISPGNDLNLLQSVCTAFPEKQFMVDANAAYSLKDLKLFQELDKFNLLMIEQPLQKGDLVDHSELQSHLKTPVCLDESIENRFDAASAIKLKSCKIINIKPARVGGISEARVIHDLAMQSGIGVWCGGMLETGIGRAHNMATATLANYIYPGDISESKRYFDCDIIEPEISFSSPGVLTLSEKPGIGVEVSKEILEKCSEGKFIF